MQGVIEFSLCLFFSKLVSYTFLYWLPSFIMETGRISYTFTHQLKYLYYSHLPN